LFLFPLCDDSWADRLNLVESKLGEVFILPSLTLSEHIASVGLPLLLLAHLSHLLDRYHLLLPLLFAQVLCVII
jgi:hypothetical protein